MAEQNGGKTIFGKNGKMTLGYPEGKKFRRNLAILHRFRDKCVFAFYAEIKDGLQKLQETISGKSLQMTLQIP